MNQLPELHKSEYEILRILWRHKNSTVRQVHDQLSSTTAWAYTTTKTHMDRMVKRGLLARSEQEGAFVYQALVSKPEGLAKMVRYFADKVLEVNHSFIVPMFAKSDALTKEEIQQLKDLLEKEDD